MTQPTDLPTLDSLPLAVYDEPAPTTPVTPVTRPEQQTDTTDTTPVSSDLIDWKVVDEIRAAVAQDLAEDTANGLDESDRRTRAMHHISGHVSDHDSRRNDAGEESWTNAERRAITQGVMQSLFGFGRLQPLLDDPTIENIEIYGHDYVLIQRTGNAFEHAEPIASSDEELLAMLAFFANQAGRSFDPSHPRLHMSLGPTARLQATGWIVERPFATIRIHRLVDVTLDNLVELELLPPELATFLRAAVQAKKSIMVAGAQGAGKTTLLRALINEIDPWEKIATLESTYELHLEMLGRERHRRLICLESVPGSDEKDANGRPIGEITMDDLARDTFRMNLDRLIIGEILGPEVIAMFEAMQTGSGSLSTIHSKSAKAIPERIVTLARKDGRVTEEFARRQVAENIDVAIYVDLVKGTNKWTGEPYLQRRITNVTSYEPGDEGSVASTVLWDLNEHGDITERTAAPWANDLRPYLNQES